MYDILQNAAENFQPQAVFPEKLPPETLKKLFLAVYYQENIFWLTSKFYRPDSDSDTLRLTYRYDEETADIPCARAMQQHSISFAKSRIFPASP